MKYYLYFLFTVLILWMFYLFYEKNLFILIDNWKISLTMVFSSFVAGATSEGGGAIAFPIFTLFLDIPPKVARNFSFAIQSIGMVAAAFFIIGKNIKYDKNAVKYCSIGGVLGLFAGSFFIIQLIPPLETKVFFVSLWLSFGVVLFVKNRFRKSECINQIKIINNKRVVILIIFGFFGGIISSIFGSGIDIFTFCLLVLYYKLDEKVATPTSVIIMAINTVFGFLIHLVLIRDFELIEFNYWLSAIPVVLIFAPLGSFIVTKLKKELIAYFLILIIIIQFFGAVYVLNINLNIIIEIFITLFVGLSFFYYLLIKSKKV